MDRLSLAAIVRAAVRVLIRNPKNCHFLGAQGSWTAKVDEALDFERTLRAMKYINEAKLGRMQIVLRFDGYGDDVILAAPALRAGDDGQKFD